MNFCCANVSVLFADDAETAQRHYSDYLKHLFHNVYKAADGDEAWRLYEIYRPDILLLDIEMPGLNGLELARRIRKRDRRTRIIIATAHVDERRLLQAVELNLTRFLPKPFGRQALKEALSKAVSELDATPRIALCDGFEWDVAKRKLYGSDREIRLTASEQALFGLLASTPGQIFSPYTIEMHLWPDAFDDSDSAARIKTLIKRLRKKVPEGSIENVYGEGYRLNIPA